MVRGGGGERRHGDFELYGGGPPLDDGPSVGVQDVDAALGARGQHERFTAGHVREFHRAAAELTLGDAGRERVEGLTAIAWRHASRAPAPPAWTRVPQRQLVPLRHGDERHARGKSDAVGDGIRTGDVGDRARVQRRVHRAHAEGRRRRRRWIAACRATAAASGESGSKLAPAQPCTSPPAPASSRGRRSYVADENAASRAMVVTRHRPDASTDARRTRSSEPVVREGPRSRGRAARGTGSRGGGTPRRGAR